MATLVILVALPSIGFAQELFSTPKFSGYFIGNYTANFQKDNESNTPLSTIGRWLRVNIITAFSTLSFA